MAETEQSPIQITESSVDDLRTICSEQPGTIYAILDACDEPRIPKKVEKLGAERAVSLYRGAAERDYWAIAPYLAQVDESLLDWIIENLWDDPWGVFAISDRNLHDVRRHFRQFLVVQDANGDEMYFCYYDPRVITAYLRTCTDSESAFFFGPVSKFLVTSADGQLASIERCSIEGLATT